MTHRRTFLKSAGLAAIAAGLSRNSTLWGESPPKRPNIVVILADDQRADYLGCAGHPVVKTPNIDDLAARGVYFSNAFATTAACTPSRTSIFLGQYERRHGVTFGSNSSLSPEVFQQSYPMRLKQAGYFTGYVGKNHTPIGAGGYESGVMDKAFDFWYGNHGHSSFYPKARHKIYKDAEADTQPEIFTEGALAFFKTNPSLAGTSKFLTARPKDKPFCLLVNFNVPHGAGTGTMRQKPTDDALYRTAYRDQADKMPTPRNYIPASKLKKRKLPKTVWNGQWISGYDYVNSREALRERQILTCQTVTGIDRLVGAVRKQLEADGLADNTIILYTSDHGLQHGEHGLGGKVFLYEESVRVPMILFDPRAPKTLQGQKRDEMVLNIDIAPTLLSLAGLEPSPETQGQSWKPLLAGKTPEWRGDFFLENMFMEQNYPRCEGVRSKEWKYIRYFDKKLDTPHAKAITASIRGEKPIYEELFHLASDPGEMTNVAAEPAHAKTLAHYRTRCATLVKTLRGTEPLKTLPYIEDPRLTKPKKTKPKKTRPKKTKKK